MKKVKKLTYKELEDENENLRELLDSADEIINEIRALVDLQTPPNVLIENYETSNAQMWMFGNVYSLTTS